MSAIDQAATTLLQKRIAEQKSRSINTLIGGTCSDFSEYRYACGYIKCLDDMMTLTDEILEDIRKG